MSEQTPAYRNPALSVAERVADLLGRMTLEEKVGQIMMWDARSDDLSFINTRYPGSILHILGEKLDRAMTLAAQNRLGIPLLVGEDAIHGHSFWKGATIFPTQLAMAASWNPDLLEQVGRVTAAEVVPTGIHWTFSPVLCLTRDLRWGRTGETFGEDPYLIGELGAALIRGYQGNGLADPQGILATAKHYAGYSETQGGRDASEADISPRKLRSYFLPPFEHAAKAGAMTFMTGYQSMEGVPSTANHWLLTEVLKDEWGFQGVLVTDWDNVGRLVKEQKVCADYVEAAIVALRAGNDIMMTTPEFYEGAIEAVRTGRLAESEIDAPCARLLAIKFRMGLFENPRRPDLERAAVEIDRAEHRAVNLEAARQSLVLLQNNGLLPLDATQLQSIAVIGPNADDDLQQLGDWSLGASQHPPEAGKHPREKTTTVLEGIRNLIPEGVELRYEPGCSIVNDDLSGIPAAVAAAAASDIIIAVVGDHLNFIGETLSTATLELQGGQVALLDALEQTGKPMIVVLINSKPLVLPAAAKRAAAIIELFNPGMAGGRALAEAIFGQLNPCGKLTISIPVHVGQQPVFYSQVRGQHGSRYADLTQEPLFPFGHGLSYTEYAYSNLRLASPTLSTGETAQVFVDVANVGQQEGTEIVQVYVSDVVTSATWVNKALKGFARVRLAPGEKKCVQIDLPWHAFEIVNAQGISVVEPGVFEILVGPSSRDRDLLKTTLTVRYEIEGGLRPRQFILSRPSPIAADGMAFYFVMGGRKQMESKTKNKQTRKQIEQMVMRAFNGVGLAVGEDAVTELKDGWFNAAYNVKLADTREVILKIAPPQNAEIMRYEKNIMATEVAAMRLVRQNPAIPVPEIYWFDGTRELCDADYFFMEKMDGDNLEHVKAILPPEILEKVEFHIGAIIRAINSFPGTYFGYDGNPDLRAATWKEAFIKIMESLLDDAARKNVVFEFSYDALRAAVMKHAPALEEISTPCLVHWDAWNPNFFVRDGRITGIIDFERALWAEPLMEAQFRQFRDGGISNSMRGYGKCSFTLAEERRKRLYDLHLALVMYTECYYRNYDTADVFNFSRQNMSRTMGWLNAN